MLDIVLFELVVYGIVLGSFIGLMAVGFNLIFGILRIVNFYHGEAYMLGAVLMYVLAVVMDFNYFGSIAIAVVAIGILGWLSYRLILYRFQGNLIGGCVATIALSMAIMNGMWVALGPFPRAIPSVVTGHVELLGATLVMERVIVIVISFVVILTLAWFIKYTKLGKAMRAVQQDSEAALSLGVNINLICGIAFGVATALAALAGVTLAPLFAVTAGMGTHPLMLTFVAVILGGLGSIVGALIAALIIGLQQSLTASFWGTEYALTISFAVAMVVLIFRPTGLMGHK